MSRNPSPHTPRQKLNRLTPGAAEVLLGNIVNELITAVNQLIADKAVLEAKLNADAGVTDTNYGAADTVTAALTVLDAR